MVSDTIQFVYNNKIHKVQNPNPNQTILDFIRSDLKKTGTKEGCAEGGCGACTVVIGELKNNKLIYKSINSCISFLPVINGKHLILIENLSFDNKLHPIQEAMVKFHGSQCGFCTPGIVMSLSVTLLPETELMQVSSKADLLKPSPAMWEDVVAEEEAWRAEGSEGEPELPLLFDHKDRVCISATENVGLDAMRMEIVRKVKSARPNNPMELPEGWYRQDA